MKVYSGPNPNTSLFHIFKFASQLGSNGALNHRIQLHNSITCVDEPLLRCLISDTINQSNFIMPKINVKFTQV